MEVRVAVLGQVLLGHRAYAEAGHAGALGHRIVDLQDDHVAAVAVAAVEVASRGRALLEGRDDLEEVVAGGTDHVDEAPLGDAGIAIGHVDAEDVAELLAGAFEILGDEDALAELHHGNPPNLVFCALW